ncbi:MAG: hypothetical protein RBR08_09785 [Desulforegulaceae bacterium]|nr:hypothetical protein [Desulforegulaceae bacterium]
MTGEIKVKISTSGRGGQEVEQEFYAYTNDPKNRKVNLKVNANVESIVSIKPDRVHLWGNSGDKISETIKITPEKGYEFKILDIIAANGKEIEYKLEQNQNKSYSITVLNKKKDKGTYSDILFLKTDSKFKPALRINIFGNIK